MDYSSMHDKLIDKLGPDRIKELIERHTDITFTKDTSDWLNCKGDAGDKTPSAGFHSESWVFNDFRGKTMCLEQVLGRGDKSLGWKILFDTSGFKAGELGFNNGKIPEKLVSDESISKSVKLFETKSDLEKAKPIFLAFIKDCCDDLMAIDYVHNTVHWVEITRRIPRQVLVNRGMGLASDRRLDQLATNLENVSKDLAAAVRNFKLRTNNLLVWCMSTKDIITRLKFRGVPEGENRKFFTLSFANEHIGWMGDPQPGELFCFEGEFNLLMCDHQNGSPINGVALGGSSGAQKDAELIRSLSPDLTIIADNDDPGRKMAQTIANVKAASVVYPVGVKDADDFIKSGKTFKDLLALKQMIVPTWIGLSDKIKKLVAQDINEANKTKATKSITEALDKKGRFIHTTTGDLLFLEN